MALRVDWYDGNEEVWDKFMLRESMNGTFLQTRKFINYHNKGKFEDASLCIYKGNELVAAVLGCVIREDDKRILFAHKGTTFGGITISKKIYSVTAIEEMMLLIENFIKEVGFSKVYIKTVAPIYQRESTDLIDYFLYKNGYTCYSELNFYMGLSRYYADVLNQFSSGKRRDYRYSLKSNLIFTELHSESEIGEFYEVLQKNIRKLGIRSVHTESDLLDLKFNRFKDEIKFYGVYSDEVMIAGSMIFIFDNKVFHTQYLSSDEEYLSLFPMDFLITNLIEVAVDMNMEKFSFGICTEDQGRYLNMGLSRFKEGFGTEYCINRSYEKEFA